MAQTHEPLRGSAYSNITPTNPASCINLSLMNAYPGERQSWTSLNKIYIMGIRNLGELRRDEEQAVQRLMLRSSGNARPIDVRMASVEEVKLLALDGEGGL